MPTRFHSPPASRRIWAGRVREPLRLQGTRERCRTKRLARPAGRAFGTDCRLQLPPRFQASWEVARIRSMRKCSSRAAICAKCAPSKYTSSGYIWFDSEMNKRPNLDHTCRFPNLRRVEVMMRWVRLRPASCQMSSLPISTADQHRSGNLVEQPASAIMYLLYSCR